MASFAFSAQEQIRVEMNEYVDQTVTYNPLESTDGIWFDSNENQSYYNLTGYIVVTNQNPNGKTMSDIYISFSFTNNITLPTLSVGRTGTFVSNDTSSGSLILHIPEIEAGENSTWIYSINTSAIRPPLNLSTAYSLPKVLAGQEIEVVDTLVNTFGNFSYQLDTCVQNIVLTQTIYKHTFTFNFQDSNPLHA